MTSPRNGVMLRVPLRFMPYRAPILSVWRTVMRSDSPADWLLRIGSPPNLTGLAITA